MQHGPSIAHLPMDNLLRLLPTFVSDHLSDEACVGPGAGSDFDLPASRLHVAQELGCFHETPPSLQLVHVAHVLQPALWLLALCIVWGVPQIRQWRMSFATRPADRQSPHRRIFAHCSAVSPLCAIATPHATQCSGRVATNAGLGMRASAAARFCAAVIAAACFSSASAARHSSSLTRCGFQSSRMEYPRFGASIPSSRPWLYI